MRRRKNLNADRTLANISSEVPANFSLPLVHVTPTWPASEVIKEGKLTTNWCDVFGVDLLYFFALRPAYRFKFGNEESHQLSRFPVVFVLDASAIEWPRHVYPFDTGGAAKGAFDSTADKFVPLEDYALEPTLDAVSSFIRWAFGNVQNYYDGFLKKSLPASIPPHQSSAVSYIDIARLGRKGSNEHDTRASSIEVSSSHNIDLRDNIRLMICPKQYLEGNEPIINLVAPLIDDGLEVRFYDWQANRAPDDYQADILRIAREYYEREGILNDA